MSDKSQTAAHRQASDQASAASAPAEPQPDPVASSDAPPLFVIPASDVLCAGCGEVLVHIERSNASPDKGAAMLHVYERSILRPHKLTASDPLPLPWRCPTCGTVTIIGAPSA